MLHLENIIKGCKKQQADSQKLLYEHYFGIMMSICRRYTDNSFNAEEMLNNGFLKIFININQYEGKGSFEGWIKRTMVNSCLDFFKTKQNKQQKQILNVVGDEGSDTYLENKLYDAGAYSNIEIDQKFEKDDLLAILNQLPPLTKTIFNLLVFEEYTHKEIAEELNIGERTSQWHFSNAKKTLAEILNKKTQNKKAAGL